MSMCFAKLYHLTHSHSLKIPQPEPQAVLLPMGCPHRRANHVVRAQRPQTNVGILDPSTLEINLVLPHHRPVVRQLPVYHTAQVPRPSSRGARLGRAETAKLKIPQPRRQQRLTRHLDVCLAQTPHGVKVAEQERGHPTRMGTSTRGGSGRGEKARDVAAEVGHLARGEDVGVDLHEVGPGGDGVREERGEVAVEAFGGADDVDAHVWRWRRRVALVVVVVAGVDGEEGDEAGLVAYVEAETFAAMGVLPARFPCGGVGGRFGAGPGNGAEAGYGVAFEEVGGQGELGVSDVEVFEDGGAFVWAEEGESSRGLEK